MKLVWVARQNASGLRESAAWNNWQATRCAGCVAKDKAIQTPVSRSWVNGLKVGLVQGIMLQRLEFLQLHAGGWGCGGGGEKR